MSVTPLEFYRSAMGTAGNRVFIGKNHEYPYRYVYDIFPRNPGFGLKSELYFQEYLLPLLTPTDLLGDP